MVTMPKGYYLVLTRRVQVPTSHRPAPNLYYNHNYPNPKYPIIGHMDPQWGIAI